MFLPCLHFLLEGVSLTPFSTFIHDIRLKLLHFPNMDWIITILLEFRISTNHRTTDMHFPTHYHFGLFYHHSSHSWLELQIQHNFTKAMGASNGLVQNWAYEPSTVYQDWHNSTDEILERSIHFLLVVYSFVILLTTCHFGSSKLIG